MKFLCLILVVSYCCFNVTAFPDGAPSTACDDMIPYHYGSVDSQDPSPYQVTVDQTNIGSDSTVHVHLKSINDVDKFKGYLVKAFDEKDQVTGMFTGESKTIDCSAKPKVTHGGCCVCFNLIVAR